MITAAREGKYKFDVRRWPKEANAPISGIPSVNNEIDAWDAGGGKKSLIYAGQSDPFKSLPVAFIRLKIGEQEVIKKVSASDTGVIFDVLLNRQNYEVKAELLNEQKQLIAGAYYVCCKKD